MGEDPVKLGVAIPRKIFEETKDIFTLLKHADEVLEMKAEHEDAPREDLIKTYKIEENRDGEMELCLMIDERGDHN